MTIASKDIRLAWLDQPIGKDKESNNVVTFGHTIEAPVTGDPEARAALTEGARGSGWGWGLKPIDRQILVLRYGLDGGTPLHVKEIAATVGPSADSSGQIVRSVRNRLEALLGLDDDRSVVAVLEGFSERSPMIDSSFTDPLRGSSGSAGAPSDQAVDL